MKLYVLINSKTLEYVLSKCPLKLMPQIKGGPTMAIAISKFLKLVVLGMRIAENGPLCHV